MNLKPFIDQLDLGIDETYRGDCPVCQGKNTFTATRSVGGIIYNCYKNSCEISGKSARSITLEDITALRSTKDNRGYAVLHEPDHWTRAHPKLNSWLNNYGLSPHRVDTRYDVKEDRVVFLIKKDRKVVDAAGRCLARNQTPKWKRYADTPVPYTHGDGDLAVVVEDCISASVVGEMENITGFALLGTNLLDEHIDFLKPYSKIVVALDPDARKKTLKITSELRSHFPYVYAMNLHDDLKYRLPLDMHHLRKVTNEYGTSIN